MTALRRASALAFLSLPPSPSSSIDPGVPIETPPPPPPRDDDNDRSRPSIDRGVDRGAENGDGDALALPGGGGGGGG
eukprot:15849-Pelagococcus_subviridis.AAC.1